MIKQVFYCVLVATLAFGCNSQPSKPKPPRDGVYYDPADDTVNFTKYVYKNGIVVSEQSFKNNRIEGTVKEYYENGQLRVTVEYADAKRNGMSVVYYQGGAKRSEVPYKDGKINGTEINYYEDGAVASKVPYENGTPIPGIEEYKKDGTKLQQPSLVFKQQGAKMEAQLDNSTYRNVKYFNVSGKEPVELPLSGSAGSLRNVRKGSLIRAVYRTPFGNDGVVEKIY
ncbi:MAG: hypothetical protein LBC98_01620 [Prevotellaceae bacterium]|jgi:hypothetical protein|nr:hypothetical protein [Prevotellaceae bacterium]